jgi:hypothetical protein
MPSGSHLGAAGPLGQPGQQRGVTYLLLLFGLALGGAGLAALGESWELAAQREREAELLFRGGQFSQALASWRDTPVAARAKAPRSLEDLLSDERVGPPVHHLRQLYVDPFTGQADWELLRDPQGQIVAVTSRSRRPALRRQGVALREGSNPKAPAVGDWLFTAEPAWVATPAGKKP